MKVGIRKNKLKKGYSYTVFVDYGIVNGSRKRTPLETFSKSADAEKYKTKMQSQLDNNTFIDIPDINFSEAIDEWMENYVLNNCEPNTYESYKTVNIKYLKPCLGHIPFKIISSPQGIDIINDYYKYLRFDLSSETYMLKSGEIRNKKNLSYNTIKHHKAQICGIFTYFINCKKITNNIGLNTTIPKTDEEKSRDIVVDDVENFEDDNIYEEQNFLTPEQAVQILNLFMNTDMMLPVFLAALVGLRRSEIAGALKDKLDLNKRKLIIKTVRVRCGGKTIFKKKCKSKTSTRILYVPQILIEIINLDQKRIERNRATYGEDYVESKFLCVSDRGKPLSVSHMSKTFKNKFDKFVQQEKAKDPNFVFPYITLHKLRRLNISVLLANGCVLTDVKDNAGHSNIHTTMIYTETYTQGKKEIADKTDEIYKPLLHLRAN